MSSARLNAVPRAVVLTGLFTVVADLDDDANPEIVTAGASGLFVVEHDGVVKHSYTSGGHGLDLGAFAPPTVHDFDGDGEPEIGLGARSGFTVFENVDNDGHAVPASVIERDAARDRTPDSTYLRRSIGPGVSRRQRELR